MGAGEFCKTTTNNPMKTRISSLLPASALVIVSTMAFCSLQMRADTIALSFTSGAGSGTQQPHNLTLGWSFTLSSSILVTQLGLWDGAGPGTGGSVGDGFGSAHDVTLWTSAGVSLATATIPAGTTANLVNDFRYVSLLSPTLLAPGTYVISAYYAQTSFDIDFANAGTITTASGVTYGTAGDLSGASSSPFHGSRSILGNFFPTTDIEFAPKSFFGPNFQFNGAVPEASSTLMLLLLGVAAIFSVYFPLARGQSKKS
jgi:hypothetical protein